MFVAVVLVVAAAAAALVLAVASAGRAAVSAAAASARACLPLLASLFALPSSLLGADPFLYHTALLGPNHCLQTLLSVSCCRMPLRLLSCLLPDRFSLFSALLRTLHQAIESAPQLLRPFAAPSLARRNARSDEIRPPSPARYEAVWCDTIPLTKTLRPITE